jgi:predicted dehydrogenase
MAPLRTAIYGTGSFAHRHARILAAMPDEIELVGFCNRTVEKAQAFADEYTGGRAQVYGDHHTMLDELPLDLLVITVAPAAHTDEVTLAAERGVHVFIEKPIALTSEKAWEMVADSEKAGIQTQVGFMLRFGAAVEKLKSLIDSGQAGPLGLMTARYFSNALHADWWRRRELSGGQLVEQVIHMVDLMRYLMGDPLTVFSRQNNLFHRDVPDYNVEDVSATLTTFASGALGVIYATNGAIPNRWINDYRVVAKNVTVDFSDANHADFTYTAQDGIPTEKVASAEDYYRKQFVDLITAIRTGGTTRVPMREGAKSLDLALAATKSAQEQCEIHLSG